MFYRSIAEFEAKATPTAAETALIAACRAGMPCELGDGTLPDAPHPSGADSSLTIRAALLRLLIVGGTPDCGLHPSGVWVIGAFVLDELNLSFETGKGRCALDNCRFEYAPLLGQTHLAQLSLEGSHLPSLFAQDCVIAGSMFLRNLIATGTVDVNAAKIGGHLDCDGATLDGAGGKALNAHGVETGQNMFLRNVTATGTVAVNGAKIGGQLAFVGSTFDGAGRKALDVQNVETTADIFLTGLTATGTVDVAGAKIGGQLDCNGAKLNGAGGKALRCQGVETGADLFLRNLTASGTVDLNGAKIGGLLSCTGATLNGAGGKALTAQRLMVKEALVFRHLKSVTGQVDLTSAHVGDLADDMSAWPHAKDDLILAGFTYDRIFSDDHSTLAARRDWLRRGSNADIQFNPQPYNQFATVLRQAGHEREARLVLLERQALSFEQQRRDRKIILNGDIKVGLASRWFDIRYGIHRGLDWIVYHLKDYVYRPIKSLFTLIVLFLIATALAHFTWTEGSFAPNSDVILTSPAWLAVERTDCTPVFIGPCDPNPALTWSNNPAGGLDWDSFNRYGYAADLVIPILDLGQTDAWAPSKDRGPFGNTLWWGRWVLAGLGWFFTGLCVAIVTGIMQRNLPEV